LLEAGLRALGRKRSSLRKGGSKEGNVESELIQRVAEQSNLSRSDVNRVLDALEDVGHAELKNTGTFTLPRFVKFLAAEKAATGLELQEIKSPGRIRGFGLRFPSVIHEGNQSSSPEEADRVRELVSEILGSATTWIDRHGIERPIDLDDILIIAPYNAQVFELQERIPGGRIGTVDKFQGQEAPIVIYSMTTSRPMLRAGWSFFTAQIA
jgi:hypothetical protein